MNMKVSLIIVNYNGAKYLKECLQSVIQQDYQSFEIIVVDNASTDESDEIIRPFLKDIKYIKLGMNGGFTGGNIAGYRESTGDLIVLLNNDTVVTRTWLRDLVEPFSYQAAVGITASKILKIGTHIIDAAGDGCTTAARGFKIGSGEPSILFNDRTFVFGACACAVAYRKKMIEEIGFLDNDFFLIHEDTDLSFRALLAGWKCLYVPEAVVYHYCRSTIKEKSDIEIYYSIRNSLFVLIKNVPIGLFAKNLLSIFLQEVQETIYYCFYVGKPVIALKAKMAILFSLKKLLKKRADIQKLRIVGNNEIQLMLTSAFEVKYRRLRSLVKMKKIGLKK